MVRITRRDFLKYCSVAAGALGLSASTLMRVENVLADTSGTAPTVVWIAGSACTGCTMTLLNSVFYTTVDDLLLNRINLKYLDTAMATAGAYVDGTQWGGANSLQVAQDVYTGSAPFVLVVEGGIPTARPAGSSTDGDFCRIGNLTGLSDGNAALGGYGAETIAGNAIAFANHANCLAILAVGTCSSFGGVPGAQGNVTGTKGVAFSGTAMGGAVIGDSAVTGTVKNVIVTNGGSGYEATPTVVFSTGSAAATAYMGWPLTTGAMTIVNGGSGFTAAPTVTFSGGGGSGAAATATINAAGQVNSVTVTSGGTGYSLVPTIVFTPVDGNGGGVAVTVALDETTGGIVKSVAVTNGGSGYTSAPGVTFSGGTPAVAATATASIQTSTDVKDRKGLAAKLINISGCPPHPDWIVGTIAHVLDTNLTLPSVNRNYQPVPYGYAEYQCNAGPCPWRYNNTTTRPNHNARYPEGNSKNLGKFKWTRDDLGCLGILGCKGRKTKADCSRRRWNSDAAETYGVNWCVGSRAGCHGCTEPTFPDKVGKFFTFA